MPRTIRLLVPVLLASMVVPATARAIVTEDEQLGSPHGAAPGAHGVEFNEVSGLRDNVSVAYTNSPPQKLCTAVTAAPCATTDFSFRAVLGPCSESVKVDCIESVTASVDGRSSAGMFSRTFPSRGVTDYSGSDSLGVPSGTAPGMWSFADAPHASGHEYQVTVMVSGGTISGNALKFPRSFFANITPVSTYQTTCDPQFNGHCMDTYYEDASTGRVRFAGVAADQDGGFRCQNWGENAMCALKHAFPAGIRFALKVRLRAAPSGWLHGRMTDPAASIVTAGGATMVTVEAAPARVPVVAASGQYASLPAKVQEWFDSNCPCGSRQPVNDWSDRITRNAVSSPVAYKESSFSQLELWREFVRDKAYALPSIWNVRTLSNSEMSAAPACVRNGTGVTGIVSTNATLYAEGPPAFDRATSTFAYKVSAPHWERDGSTPFMGSYSLMLRDDIAECLYGAPDFSTTESTISVTSENGVSKAAVTSVASTNGWWRFTATGYTHSTPVLRAKLVPKWPTIRKGRTTKVTTVARTYGLNIPAKSKVVAAVAMSSKSVCSVSRGLVVVAKKVGTCRMVIAVTPARSKKTPRPVTSRKSVTVKVSK